MEKIAAKILAEVLKRLSPELKAFIAEKIQEFEVKAKASENPWDDLFVMVLKIIFDIE